MDKQKQIEEMAKDICEISRRSYELCGDCFGEKNNHIGCKGMAELLSEKGYRKIPENVVLTREEYKTYLAMKSIETNLIEIEKDKTRKETAEKFAKLVEFHSVSTRDEEGREIFTISALGLKEILHEEFGIPYEEITEGNSNDENGD